MVQHKEKGFLEQEECLRDIAEEFARKRKRIPRIQVRHLWEDEARRAVWVGRLWRTCEAHCSQAAVLAPLLFCEVWGNKEGAFGLRGTRVEQKFVSGRCKHLGEYILLLL